MFWVMDRRVGIALILLTVAGLCLPFDHRVAQWAQALPHNHLYVFVRDMSAWGEAGPYILASLGLWVVFAIASRRPLRETSRRQLRTWADDFAFAFLAFCVTGILELTLKMLFGRERPASAPHLNSLIFHPINLSDVFQSFPSGHTQAMFTFAFLVSGRFRRLTIPAFIYAGLIATSRVIQNAHFLSDVAGGILTAWVGLQVSKAIAERWLAPTGEIPQNLDLRPAGVSMENWGSKGGFDEESTLFRSPHGIDGAIHNDGRPTRSESDSGTALHP